MFLKESKVSDIARELLSHLSSLHFLSVEGGRRAPVAVGVVRSHLVVSHRFSLTLHMLVRLMLNDHGLHQGKAA